MGKLLEINNLEVEFKTYGGNVKAVRDVSFSVDEGECVAIVGESGCGKSVTAKSILRLIPSPPGKITGGDVIFNGLDMNKISNKRLREIRGAQIGMILQDPMTSLNPTMTVGKQIAEVLKKNNYLLSSKEANKRVAEVLELVNVPNPQKRMKQYPHEFSGGMRQRVMVAMSVVCTPKLLIADEPTTALDVTIQAQILDIMKDLQKKINTSIILITHDLGVVANMASRVIVMYAGKIVESGTVDEIFSNPKHPYTLGLLKSMPRLDSDSKEDLVSIEGQPPDLFSPPVGCSFAPRCDYCMKICRMKQPEMYDISEGHITACWLQHEKAKALKLDGTVNS